HLARVRQRDHRRRARPRPAATASPRRAGAGQRVPDARAAPGLLQARYFGAAGTVAGRTPGLGQRPRSRPRRTRARLTRRKSDVHAWGAQVIMGRASEGLAGLSGIRMMRGYQVALAAMLAFVCVP